MERVYTDEDLVQALNDIETRAKFLCAGLSESIQDHVESIMVMTFLNRLENPDLTSCAFYTAKNYVMNDEDFLEKIITELPPDMIQPEVLTEYSVRDISKELWLSGENPDALDDASHTLIADMLKDALSTITPREEKVLRLRFGIEDGTYHTLNEVGQFFNLSGTRIQQIESKALRKLRHPSRAKKLKDFLPLRF